jgi:DNA-binding winged helix-turn-helix (wHTH) protein
MSSFARLKFLIAVQCAPEQIVEEALPVRSSGMKVFGEFEFDERGMQLRRGGSIVSLNGQCLELLVLMLDRGGQLITREEIKRILWPDSNVDFEHSLDVLVNRLRLALGDSGKNARYIQTVPKKGYKFVEQVRYEPSGYEASSNFSWTRSLARYASIAILAALIALLIAHTRYQKFVPPQGAPAPTSVR